MARTIPESELFPREHRLFDLLLQCAPKQVPAALRPDWPYWENMADVTVMDAVYLSLGLDPRECVADINFGYVSECLNARTSDLTERTRIQTSLGMLEKARDLTTERTAQALSHIAVGKLPYRLANPSAAAFAPLTGVRPTYMVELRSFRAWGESLPVPYIFPDQFPGSAGVPTTPALHEGGAAWVGAASAEYDEQLKAALSPPEASRASEDEKPLDPRERTTMVRIICALMAMAGDQLPEGKETTIIEEQIALLGFDRPKEAAIRRALQAAKAERPEKLRRA